MFINDFRNWPTAPTYIEITSSEVTVERGVGGLKKYECLHEYLQEIGVRGTVFLRALTNDDRLKVLKNGFLGKPSPTEIGKICSDASGPVAAIQMICMTYAIGIAEARALVAAEKAADESDQIDPRPLTTAP